MIEFYLTLLILKAKLTIVVILMTVAYILIKLTNNQSFSDQKQKSVSVNDS